MSEHHTTTEQPTIHTPRPGQLAVIGATAAGAVLAWILCITAYLAVAHDSAPRELAAVVLGLAVTASVVAGHLWQAWSTQRAAAHNHSLILTAIGALAAEVEQMGAKVDKIDPWTIYTAVASDLLGHENRGRP